MGVTTIASKLSVVKMLKQRLGNAEQDLLQGSSEVYNKELRLIKEILDVRFDPKSFPQQRREG